MDCKSIRTELPGGGLAMSQRVAIVQPAETEQEKTEHEHDNGDVRARATIAGATLTTEWIKIGRCARWECSRGGGRVGGRVARWNSSWQHGRR